MSNRRPATASGQRTVKSPAQKGSAKDGAPVQQSPLESTVAVLEKLGIPATGYLAAYQQQEAAQTIKDNGVVEIEVLQDQAMRLMKEVVTLRGDIHKYKAAAKQLDQNIATEQSNVDEMALQLGLIKTGKYRYERYADIQFAAATENREVIEMREQLLDYEVRNAVLQEEAIYWKKQISEAEKQLKALPSKDKLTDVSEQELEALEREVQAAEERRIADYNALHAQENELLAEQKRICEGLESDRTSLGQQLRDLLWYQSEEAEYDARIAELQRRLKQNES